LSPLLSGTGLAGAAADGDWRARGPLVRFIGFEASEDACDYALVAPESVAITIKSLPPDSPEPRMRIGFLQDEPGDTS
jgi:hypothetical protein